MDEFIKKLIERLKELREKGVNCEGCSNDCVNDGCEQRAIDKSIEIVNQLAEEYNGGWIPCSEQSVPNEDGRYEVTCETLWNDGRKSYSTSTLSFYKENGWCAVFGINTKVIAWRKPAPYHPKGE